MLTRPRRVEFIRPLARPDNIAAKLRSTLLTLSLILLAGIARAEPPAVVIIIDDLGNNLSRGREAIDLPGKLNYAFLPHTPHAATLARRAHRAGKEVMLHAPMTPLRAHDPGPGALTPALPQADFLAQLERALAEVPHVRGVNNHMGSHLTQQRQPMEWLMQDLARRQLYFVDSRTSPRSVAASIALDWGVPHLSRQVFLDHDRGEAAVAERFDDLMRIAQREGFAVAIGHPYPETLALLRERLPALEREGVQLMLVSEALRLQPAEQGTTLLARGQSLTSIPAAAM